MKLHNSLEVEYQTAIIENGVEVKKNAPTKNLLLDSGLDGIAERKFWETFDNCVLGDGTTPVKRDSGSVTVSITSEVATASAGYFESADVGRLLKLDSGQEVKITGYTSTTEVAVAGASDDAASECTIWYVNETGHANETNRTNTVGQATGDVQSTWDGSQIELKRTFMFPLESAATTYKEIGWSHTNNPGNNLLGRDLINGGAGDSVGSGQQYKVVVKLRVTPTPITPATAGDVGTNGFATTGESMFASFNSGFGGDNSNNMFSGNQCEPAASKYLIIANQSFSLPANVQPNTKFNLSGPHFAMSADTYVAGSFEKTFRVTLGVSDANGGIYGLGLRHNPSGDSVDFVHRFDAAQTKDSDHTLEIAVKFTWGRTLTN